MAKFQTEIPVSFRPRAWYSHKAGAYAYLVDAPITFGHSQLVVSRPADSQEKEAFLTAAPDIASCIDVLGTLLPDIMPMYRNLKKYKRTDGPYVKTLVLKASASEKPTEHKIHLVPIFQSHKVAADRSYQIALDKEGSGGLPHWVGERERIFDYDARDRKSPAHKTRVEEFRLETLASRLEVASKQRG